jgi:DnaJ-class molecular chaperone
MTEPIRFRIFEIVYQNDYDIPKKVGPVPYLVKDSVNISSEALEKFRAQGMQKLIVPLGGANEGNKNRQDPEPKINFETLDLNSGAKPEQIRKAYLEAIKKYHPDKFLNRPPEVLRAAEEKTKQINTAYSILKKA